LAAGAFRDGFEEGTMDTLKPMLCSISDAAAALGLGRSKTYQLIAEGKLATVTIGRRRLVRLDSIRALALGEAA
jgi:excisionase family DNA binding protein